MLSSLTRYSSIEKKSYIYNVQMVHVSGDCNFALKVDWDEAVIIHETGT